LFIVCLTRVLRYRRFLYTGALQVPFYYYSIISGNQISGGLQFKVKVFLSDLQNHFKNFF